DGLDGRPIVQLRAAAPGPLPLELLVEPGHVDGKSLLGADHFLKVERKAIGVVELEGHRARKKPLAVALDPTIVLLEEAQAVPQGGAEAFLLLPGHLRDELAAL